MDAFDDGAIASTGLGSSWVQLGVAMLATAGLIFVRLLTSWPRQKPVPLRQLPPAPHVYPPAELALFAGDPVGTPILLAIKGKVYDVSAKPEFYGPKVRCGPA